MGNAYDYLVYCIENYSVAKGMLPSETSRMFEETGADACIIDNFENLHLTGAAYMVADIDVFISNASRV